MPRTLFLFFNVNCHLCGCDIRRGLSSFQWLLFSMFLTIVNVLYPTLLATDCRAGSPRLVHLADTTLPFDSNLHDRVVSCCISLIISSRYLIVCSPSPRILLQVVPVVPVVQVQQVRNFAYACRSFLTRCSHTHALTLWTTCCTGCPQRVSLIYANSDTLHRPSAVCVCVCVCVCV